MSCPLASPKQKKVGNINIMRDKTACGQAPSTPLLKPQPINSRNQARRFTMFLVNSEKNALKDEKFRPCLFPH
jgi:hypothetical protein